MSAGPKPAPSDVTGSPTIPHVPFFPIGSPFTGGPRPLAQDPTISSVAAKHGATYAQVALAWLLHADEHILLIPGTSSLAHLEQNMATAAIALDDDDMAALNAAAAPTIATP
jgi:pyridoxine 4-dehydrogenase